MPTRIGSIQKRVYEKGGFETAVIKGTSGNDYLEHSGYKFDHIEGLEGDDIIVGGHDDAMYGGAGNDTIIGDGSDHAYGDEGDDHIEVSGWDSSVLDGGDGADTLLGGSAGDLLSGRDGDTVYSVIQAMTPFPEAVAMTSLMSVQETGTINKGDR